MFLLPEGITTSASNLNFPKTDDAAITLVHHYQLGRGANFTANSTIRRLRDNWFFR